MGSLAEDIKIKQAIREESERAIWDYTYRMAMEEFKSRNLPNFDWSMFVDMATSYANKAVDQRRRSLAGKY